MLEEHKYDERNISILLTAVQWECLAGAVCARTWERGVKLNLVSQKKRQVCVFGWSTVAHRDQVVERQSVMQKYGRYSTTATGPQVQSAFSVLVQHISHSLTLTPSVLATAELKEGHESFTTIRLSKDRLKDGFTHTCDLQQHWEWFKGLPAGAGTSGQVRKSCVLTKHLQLHQEASDWCRENR